MDVLPALAPIAVGVALVLYFAGWLVDAARGTARALGVSSFFVAVVFIGFDPENLGVGAAGSHEGVAGIALGSIIGAAMVAIVLALGITVLLAPLEFEEAPKRILALPVLAVLLFGLVALDGRISRPDGAVLLAGHAIAVTMIVFLDRRGDAIVGSAREAPETHERADGWKALGLLVLSLAGIAGGSALIVGGSETIIEWLGITDTFYGMTILALVISVEEVAREAPAALRGHPEISLGNVIGSALAFFLMNAGIIALVRPIPVDSAVLRFHLPMALATTAFVAGMVAATSRLPRWAGLVLVLAYAAFVAGSYFVGEPEAVR